jgi:hypothetical protein
MRKKILITIYLLSTGVLFTLLEGNLSVLSVPFILLHTWTSLYFKKKFTLSSNILTPNKKSHQPNAWFLYSFKFLLQSSKQENQSKKVNLDLGNSEDKKSYFFLRYFTFYFLILTTRLEFYQGTKCKIGRTSPKRVLLTWNDGNIRLDEATEPVTRIMFQRRGFDPLQRIADTDESLNHPILKWFMLVQIYRWQNPTRSEKSTRPVQTRTRFSLIPNSTWPEPTRY